ncbi:MAG: aldo/keto reductase [Candidatus Poribacteria bacterium]|nr:aldo/keto reductase [Candidatus Poribacteria bacterium]
MEYVNFGNAGVKVSQLAFGLGLRGQPDELEAQRVIEHAFELGINFIDCANLYGPNDYRTNTGRSEVVLGKALKGRRNDVVITTKVAAAIGSGPNDEGLSRYHVMREVERSLKRLDTDYIDIYLVHRFDQFTPLEETIRTLDDLVHMGKVRYVGCCNYAAWQVCKSLWIADRINAVPYICVQNLYNLLNRQMEMEMFSLIQDMGLGAMAFSPLAVGLLSGIYSPERPPPVGSLFATRNREDFPRMMKENVAQVISAVNRLSSELDKTPAQLALAWVLSHPEITVAITGADTIEHLNDNVGATGWELDDNVRDQLDSVSKTFVQRPKGSV